MHARHNRKWRARAGEKPEIWIFEIWKPFEGRRLLPLPPSLYLSHFLPQTEAGSQAKFSISGIGTFPSSRPVIGFIFRPDSQVTFAIGFRLSLTIPLPFPLPLPFPVPVSPTSAPNNLARLTSADSIAINWAVPRSGSWILSTPSNVLINLSRLGALSDNPSES